MFEGTKSPSMTEAQGRYASHTRKSLKPAFRKLTDSGKWTTINGFPAIVGRKSGLTLLHFRKLPGTNQVFGVHGDPDLTKWKI